MNKTSLYLTVISVLQFISMAFLIICCVTAPVFKQIGLSKFDSITYGVFGYCSPASSCSSASASYNPQDLSNDDSNWKLKNNARKTLGKILIIMPVAAGLNFFAFLSSLVSAIITFINQNGTISAMLFIINFCFNIIAFLAAALMCIVVFLLFYPHITWCSWLLIPAAALPLLCLPIIFTAYLSRDNKNGSKTVRDQLLDDELLDAESDDFGNDTNNNTIDDKFVIPEKSFSNNEISSSPFNKPMVLPPQNQFSQSDLTNTISSKSTGLMDDKKDEEIIYTRTLNNQSTLESTTNDIIDEYDSDNEIDDPYDKRRESTTAFSVIDNDRGTNSLNHNNLNNNSNNNSKTQIFVNPPSINSFSYSSTKDISNQQHVSNRLLEDIMNDQSNDRRNNSNSSDTLSDDKYSEFTSISQRGPNPQYRPPQNVMNLPQQGQQQNLSATLPYPQSGSAISSIYPPNTNQMNQGPQMYNNRISNNNSTNPQLPPQQRHVAPSASDMILNNNPNFMAQQPRNNRLNNLAQRNVPQQHQMNGFNNNPNNGGMPIPNAPNHFQNAYKKKMAARNNMYNNLHSSNPYGFR